MAPTITPAGQLLAGLAAGFRGSLLAAGHPGYDSARRVWNCLVDRRPALIARCAGTPDVVRAVRVAAAHRPPVSIRAGGHQVAGSAVAEGGLVIDLSGMTGVRVDPVARTAWVDAGATWARLDRAGQEFGLAAPGGDHPGTGVAGLVLGGGLGLLTRAYGLSCDGLLAVEIVTADGAVRVAGPERDPELWWAARGCGRGLGVVTRLQLRLHPLGPQVATVQVYYPYRQAEAVIRGWREVTAVAPRTVTPQLVLRDLPPFPLAPARLHGTPVVAVGAVYAGPPERAEAVLAPLRALGDPVIDVSRPVPYAAPEPTGNNQPSSRRRAFMKSHFLAELSDPAIHDLVRLGAERVGPDTAIVLRALGGAADDSGSDTSAYPHRPARFNLNIHATWPDPALDEPVLGWCRATWQTLRRHGDGGVYLGFAGLAEEAAGLRPAAYGASAPRLDRIRARYDPNEVFRAAALVP